MVRLTALLLLVALCAFWGFWKAAELGTRIRRLEEVRRSLVTLRGEIHYARTPLPEALEGLSRGREDALGSFYNRVSRALFSPDGKGLGELWREAAGSLATWGMAKPDLSWFERLGERLCHPDGEMQERSLDLELSALEERLRQLREALSPKQRVYRAVGVFAGLMAGILLL